MLYVSKLVIISKLAIISLPCLSHTTNNYGSGAHQNIFVSQLCLVFCFYLLDSERFLLAAENDTRTTER